MKTLYNDILTEDVTGSLPLGGYFLTNLTDQRLSRPSRWLDDNLISVEYDLGSAQSFDTIAILSHNITSGATFEIKTGSTSGFVTAIDTFTITHNAVNIYQEVTQSSAARYIRFEITDTSNPDGYVNVGRLMVGSGYTFPGFAPVVSRDKIDRGTVFRSQTDQIYGEKRYRVNRLSVEFPRISETQRAGYETYLDETGVSVPHVIYIDESDVCNFDFGVDVLYIVNDEARESSLELNAGRFFTTRHTMTEVF